ncbi:hypothetical protein AKJ66_04585 [candidate division MSBL1 archaeon SCGC-AAA259E22]|uniref:GINS subunit domain-containing protein n=1 Tax=candidate division MSBL1 archaeon SCGC-AAA259E22 TaxID=1698265 RepID=A0A133UDA3_9EURY|nr:hypothetical protein AKJ66_04585 [candidate division MSBL1 archaeon SCGC-AAA259E22]
MKKVEVIQDFPEVELVGRKLGPFKEGEEVEMRPWEASVLEERDFVRPVRDFSLTGVRKALIREEKSSRLEELPSSFYRTVSREVRRLREGGEVEKAEELEEAIESLVDFRIQKLARMIISSVDLGDIPAEEQVLANFLSQPLTVWEGSIGRVFEKNIDKEVGVHAKKVRRNI